MSSMCSFNQVILDYKQSLAAKFYFIVHKNKTCFQKDNLPHSEIKFTSNLELYLKIILVQIIVFVI